MYPAHTEAALDHPNVLGGRFFISEDFGPVRVLNFSSENVGWVFRNYIGNVCGIKIITLPPSSLG